MTGPVHVKFASLDHDSNYYMSLSFIRLKPRCTTLTGILIVKVKSETWGTYLEQISKHASHVSENILFRHEEFSQVIFEAPTSIV